MAGARNASRAGLKLSAGATMKAAHRPRESARFPAAAPTSWHSCKLRPQRRGHVAMWGGTPVRRAQRRSSMGATDNLGCTGHDGLDAVGDMGAYNGAWKAWAVWTTIGAVDGIGAWKTWAVSTTLADRPRQLDDPTWFIASISPLLFPLTHCEQFHASTVFIALHALARPTCSYPCPCLVFACLPPWTSGRPCSLSTELLLYTRPSLHARPLGAARRFDCCILSPGLAS